MGSIGWRVFDRSSGSGLITMIGKQLETSTSPSLDLLRILAMRRSPVMRRSPGMRMSLAMRRSRPLRRMLMPKSRPPPLPIHSTLLSKKVNLIMPS